MFKLVYPHINLYFFNIELKLNFFEILNSLKNVYLALKDTESMKALDTRLNLLKNNCIDFLSE